MIFVAMSNAFWGSNTTRRRGLGTQHQSYLVAVGGGDLAGLPAVLPISSSSTVDGSEPGRLSIAWIERSPWVDNLGVTMIISSVSPRFHCAERNRAPSTGMLPRPGVCWMVLR